MPEFNYVEIARDEPPKKMKAASGFTIASGIALGVALAPVLAVLLAVLIGLIFVLLALCIYLLGGFLWLITASTVNPFPFANTLFGMAGGLFGFLGPIAVFCFAYITPYLSWLSAGLGVIGFILSVIALAGEVRRHREFEEEKPSEEQQEAEYQAMVAANPGKKVLPPKKRRRKKSQRALCVLFIVLCILFIILSVAAAIFAPQLAAAIKAG